MAPFRELPDAVRVLYPAEIPELYEIHDWRGASVLFATLHPEEWTELMTVLGAFRLRYSDIARGGGNKSPIAKSLDGHLLEFGWQKETFATQVTVATKVRPGESVYDVPTHEVDCFKNRVALEVEWNNKDPFFDRDLNNFRLLFELRAIDLGVIVTRSRELRTVLRGVGRSVTTFGESTTHMGKLLPKVDGGGAGGCPVLVFGITPALYVEDSPAKDDTTTSTVASIAPLEDEDD